jgi:hypothetical protein
VFYERVQAQLREKRNWAVSSDMAMLYRGTFTTRFYRHLHRYVHRDFRLRRTLARKPTLKGLAFVAYCTVAIPLSWLKLQALRLNTP